MPGHKEYKHLLLGLRKQLEEKIDKTGKHIRHESGSVSQDFSEQASERNNDEVVMNIDELARSELNLVKSALKRIDDGDYGTCEQCGEAIEVERLKALPYTNMCKTCAFN